MNSINWKAVLVGWGIDIAASTIFITGLTVLIGVAYGVSGNQHKVQDVFNSKDFLIYSLIFGLLFTVVGGYVAARIAGRREILHSVIVGVLSILTGLGCSQIGSAQAIPGWFTTISHIITIPAAMLGGFVRAKRIL
ncbi:hypothetical protein L0156_25780 [bacterium]|nr:hypothetical protein [bacterium]